MNKHMTQEVAIKSAWMILEGLGFSRKINGDLEKTVAAVFESAPAADVVAVVRCGECANWQSGWKPSAAKDGTHFCANVGLCTPSDWYCADGERKDGGQDDA